jgi:hypothetical protein
MSVIWIAALSAAIQITHAVEQFSECSVSRAQRVVELAGAGGAWSSGQQATSKSLIGIIF